MDMWDEISKYGEELLLIPQGPKKEKMANEILALHKKIMQNFHSGSDEFEESIGQVHAYAMSACRELEMFDEAMREGEEALEFEDSFEDDFTVRILSEMLGMCMILYKRSDNRNHLNSAKMYGKKLLALNSHHKLKPLILGLNEL